MAASTSQVEDVVVAHLLSVMATGSHPEYVRGHIVASLVIGVSLGADVDLISNRLKKIGISSMFLDRVLDVVKSNHSA